MICNLGATYFNSGDDESALDHLDYALLACGKLLNIRVLIYYGSTAIDYQKCLRRMRNYPHAGCGRYSFLTMVTSAFHISLLFVNGMRENYPLALELFNLVLEVLERRISSHEERLASCRSLKYSTEDSLSRLYRKMGQTEEAIRRQRALVDQTDGDDDDKNYLMMLSLASNLDEQGRYDEALEWATGVLQGCEKLWGNQHEVTYAAFCMKFCCLCKMERLDEAEALLTKWRPQLQLEYPKWQLECNELECFFLTNRERRC